jgi:hypothetical protein
MKIPMRQRPVDRRDFMALWSVPGIAAGFQALAGTPFTSPETAPLQGFSGWNRAKRVLFLFVSGGPSHIDSLDMKPEAPEEVRGAFRTIQTVIPGYRICEHLPLLSKALHHCCIFRSMSHDDSDHGTACYLTLTGRFHPQKSGNPPPRAEDAPVLAAVYSRLRQHATLPFSAAHVNGPLLTPIEPGPGQGISQLPGWTRPAELGNPLESFHRLPLLRTMPSVRVDGRRVLVENLERTRDKQNLQGSPWSQQQARAYQLLDQPTFRKALNWEEENAKTLALYGRHRMGRGCLLGRRLLEAGVPWVTVFLNHSVRGQDDHPKEPDWYGWDTHNDIFQAMREFLLPRLDQSLSTLLEDLHQRGLLKDTLVICAGEFGRAPLVAVERNFAGVSPGRKHWPAAYSVLVAGAGTARGAVVGQTDRHGGQVLSGKATPSDMMATVLASLGVEPDSRITDTLGKEFSACEGKPLDSWWRGA